MSKDFCILVIEDDLDLLELLEFNLTKEGYDVIGCKDTRNAMDIIKEEEVHLLIVDRNLPDIEGSNFVADLRQKGYENLVFFLTAKTSQEDVLEGFQKGADDYIKKPFDMQELLLRISRAFKRSSGKKERLYFRDIVVDLSKKEVFVGGKKAELSKLEFKLLCEFINNKSIVLSRDYLLDNVWQETNFQEKTVNVAIRRLKEKIDPYENKKYIKSVRGHGYMLC